MARDRDSGDAPGEASEGVFCWLDLISAGSVVRLPT